MVVSAREEASKIGVEILQKGGNAFDAMVATELALAVSHPQAGNIGGGGFMVFRKANGETGALDYREKAPLSASKDMYLDEKGNVIEGKAPKQLWLPEFQEQLPGYLKYIENMVLYLLVKF